MRLRHAFHRFGSSLPYVINISDLELDWTGDATLVAPSGIGKTTLFRLFSGWYSPCGDSQCEWSSGISSHRDVRFVGGHRGLLPWKTVKQNFHFQFPGMANDAIREATSELCLDVGITDLFPYELSLGMYKRVELALAVLANPRILLLDEFYSSIGDEQKTPVRSFVSTRRKHLLTWTVAHEERLCEWIGGPQFSFVMSGQTVTGIKRV